MAQKFRIFLACLLLSQSIFAAPHKKEKLKPFPIVDEGTEFPVQYEKYGTFTGVGTTNYKYKIEDRAGLAKAMGIGLYPNNGASMMADPLFVEWNKKKTPHLNPWDYVNTGEPQTEFYAWVQSTLTTPGIRMFYLAQALAESGHLKQAVKAYYSILVNFPKEPCWAADNSFVWYLAGEALSRIESLTLNNPEIGFRLKGASFKVENGNDTDLKNDIFTVNPGTWERYIPQKNVDLSKLRIIQKRGQGQVRLVQYENKQWQLLVDNKPYVVHGITYSPTPVGVDLAGVANKWMSTDRDHSGKADTAYESWVDANRNNRRDPDEKPIGDFELMRQMGVNTIRLYQNADGLKYDPDEFDKSVLRDMYETYGIRAIMGNFLGAYTIGSGAVWEDGTDYTDEEQKTNMKNHVRDYVMDHKDEPYVLMWLLGNENLMPADYSGVNSTRTKASEQVEAYLKFVNEVAAMIHQIDPNHPVGVGNLDLIHLEEHAKFAPQVDIFGANSYRGAMGFGDLFKKVQENFDRPVLITEYGCDAFNSVKNVEDEEAQARYHEGAWKSIEQHLAGGPEEGNAIGGVIFEFLDEWWKSQQGSFKTHEATKDSQMAFPDGWSSEEYLGIMSQGDGQESPLLRQPRQVYYLYKDKLWKK